MDETPKKTGRFGPGNPGKPKGAVSKINADVKSMILEALHHAGGAEYLCMQAYDNPKAFMALVSRVLPLTVAGDPQNPLVPPTDDAEAASRIAQLLAAARARKNGSGG